MKGALYLLVALFLPSALAISLQSPADNFVSAGQSIQFAFVPGLNSSACSLYIDGIAAQSMPATEGKEITVSKTMADGNFSWEVNCTSESSEKRKLVIDSTAPGLSIAEIPGPINYSKIQFNYTASDINIMECSLYLDSGGWSPRKTVAASSGIIQNITHTVPDGTHKWGVICTDIAQNQAAANSSITIDTTPPEISLTSPGSFITAGTATLSLSTSEPAECRYTKTENLSYEEMQPFEISGGAMHRNFITGMTDGIHRYIITCADSLMNKGGSRATFEVNIPPSAKISIDASSPLKAGTYKVSLETSKALAGPPTLTYMFDDGQRTVPIFLSGYGNFWEGNMIVEDTNKKLVGGFAFSGTDIRGTTGTIISDGKFFLVDTVEPQAPDSLKAEPEGQGIRLKWHSANDDTGSFNIYRGTGAGIGYAELYDSANGTSYLDRAASSQVTYYYRVAAVDRAGNLGALSPEAYATSASQPAPVQSAEKKVLPPALVPKVDNELYRIAKLMLDVNEALLAMQESPDPEEAELVEKLGARKKIEEAKSTLGRLQEKLDGMKEQYMQETELAYELGKADLEIRKIERSTIGSVSVSDKVTFEQPLTPQDISEGADELISGLGLNPAMKESYVSGMDLNLFSISGKAVAAKIRYLNLTEDEKTIVTKKISVKGSESLEDVIIIEMIPKEFAESAGKISFISEQPEVLRDDPVVKYGYSRFREVEISYSVQGNRAQEAKKITSAPLSQLQKLDSGDSPTGLAVLSSFEAIKGNPAISIGIFAIIVLLGYYLIFLEGMPRIKGKKQPGKEQEIELVKGNIEVIKAELSERIYPALTSIQQSVQQKEKEKRDEKEAAGLYALQYEMKMLIEEAKTHVDYGKPEKAAALYPKIMEHYRMLPEEGKREAYAECLKIRQGIRGK